MWTSPNVRDTPTIEPWGHCDVGTATIDLRTLVYDLTTNMYGHTTETHDLLLQITPGNTESQQQSLKLPGKVRSAFVLKRGTDLFCIFDLVCRQYSTFGSNATRNVERSFIVAIPSGACWVSEKWNRPARDSLFLLSLVDPVQAIFECVTRIKRRFFYSSAEWVAEWEAWNASTPAECPVAVPAYLAFRCLFPPRLFPSLITLRKESVSCGSIVVVFSLLALPVRLLLFPIRWLSARKVYREALARQSTKQSGGGGFNYLISEMPLTRESTECFTTG